jgi:conjugative relaxase-like TrwC/TraI family protein
MLTIRAMSDGGGYSANHLEHNDYYSENERVTGKWFGRGAEMLGMEGAVRHGDFEALREGCDPINGKFLRQRKSADRTAADGTVQSHGRNLYDLTVSAPKSVSVMAILGGDARLTEAHAKAVAEMLRELEIHAAARVRQSGANSDRATGNLVAAVYRHDASRELDPQVHTHCVAANLTFDGAEGRWKALQASGIYERRKYLTEVYRNALAREVRELGYGVENRMDGRGRDCGFEIVGVPDELMERFSQRSRQRDKAVNKFMEEHGRPPTDNETAVLIRETRAGKLAEISTDQLRKRQRSRMEPEEIRLLEGLKPQTQPKPVRFPAAATLESLESAKAHVFERVSVANDHEVLTEALCHGRGNFGHRELKEALAMQEKSGAILRHGNEIATGESLRREREMVERVNRGVGAATPLGRRFTPDASLNAEQKDVIAFVLNSRDRVVNVSGAAGTGKTATLRELRRGLLESGHAVTAVAPTRSAVEELQKVGFADAVTVERLLQDPQTQRRGGVLVVDEAGMVSSRQMGELLKLPCRVIFSGDTRQIQGVEAGDALRILEKESRMKTVSLTKERRQTTAAYREAVHLLRSNPSAGFERLDAMGAVREVAEPDRARAVADVFADCKAQNLNPLVVCATHEEIGRVTEAIRAKHREAGELGEARQMARDVSLNWTAAQKGDVSRLRPGQFLIFHGKVKGVARNETLEVVKAEKDNAIVRNEKGETRVVTDKQAKSFDVCERRPIEIASGDRLLLTANRRDAGFRATNGEIATVAGIDGQSRIHLRDGRVIPADFRQFAHGYAVTAHRSQGKTVDAVIISGDGMRRELFYVAASRGREGIAVITGDRERLRESIGCPTARQSATELARRRRPGLHQGIRRGMEAARRLAQWAVRQFETIQTIRRQTPMNQTRQEIEL